MCLEHTRREVVATSEAVLLDMAFTKKVVNSRLHSTPSGHCIPIDVTEIETSGREYKHRRIP